MIKTEDDTVSIAQLRYLRKAQMNDEFQYKFELLKQEIEILQNGIRTYDGILFTIKGWSITVFSTFIFFAADKQKTIFIVYSTITILLFWILDSLFKSIQKVYTHRYNQLERFLQGDEFSQALTERTFKTFPVPNIQNGFNLSGKEKLIDIFHSAIQFHNYILYLSMLTLAIIILTFSI
ncbi:MAG: hypothetical protein QTN59_02110 [Candidatus Electrothrix communis]|nr:MAG: hypothetical protein QTN59_02110 [Candidatus Electrothrix communis]